MFEVLSGKVCCVLMQIAWLQYFYLLWQLFYARYILFYVSFAQLMIKRSTSYSNTNTHKCILCYSKVTAEMAKCSLSVLSAKRGWSPCSQLRLVWNMRSVSIFIIISVIIVLLFLLLLVVCCAKLPFATANKVMAGISQQVTMVQHYEHAWDQKIGAKITSPWPAGAS